jgi:anti-sigma B factor antagonist
MPEEFAPKPFRCEQEARENVLYLRPYGDLDMSTAPVLEQALRDGIERGEHSIVVDLRGLNFMDSTGLTLVSRFNNESRRDGFNLALIAGEQRVMRLFSLTGLAEYFTFVSG